MAIQAIETKYKGYRFRSRTEARWAVFMDALGIPYIYEPEGFLFDDGTTYLPDFYLPNQSSFLECKGVMSEKDEKKIKRLAIASGKDVVVGYPDMKFVIYDHYHMWRGKIHKATDSFLEHCLSCDKYYFVSNERELNACRCCNYAMVHPNWEPGIGILCNGGHDIMTQKASDAISKAKSARFEFGEDGR